MVQRYSGYSVHWLAKSLNQNMRIFFYRYACQPGPDPVPRVEWWRSGVGLGKWSTLERASAEQRVVLGETTFPNCANFTMTHSSRWECICSAVDAGIIKWNENYCDTDWLLFYNCWNCGGLVVNASSDKGSLFNIDIEFLSQIYYKYLYESLR